jgi:hypothetical protein
LFVVCFLFCFFSCSVFTSSQLEVLVTGNPDIDISLLRSKTEYRGNLSARDKHVLMFWEVLEDMSQEQRKKFLQFVWGRNRYDLFTDAWTRLRLDMPSFTFCSSLCLLSLFVQTSQQRTRLRQGSVQAVRPFAGAAQRAT